MEGNNGDMQYLEDYYPKIKQMYEDDLIVECVDYVKDLESKIFSGEVCARDNKDDEISDVEYFKSNQLISRIYDDGNLFYKCWDAYKYLQTKKADRNSDGIENWFRKEDDTNMITICGRAVVNANIMVVLTTLAEVELGAMKGAEIEKTNEFTTFRWGVKIKVKIPAPFSDREIYAMGLATTIPNTKSCMIAFRSLSNGFYGVNPPEEDPEIKRMELNYGFVHIKYIDEDYVEITNGYNVDPKISVIPTVILNTFVKEIAYYIIKDIQDTLEGDTSVYKKRLEEKKEFYDKVWQRLKNVIDA